MLQDYLRAYPPPNVTGLFKSLSTTSHPDAYSQIQQMAQILDVYLSKYPA